MKKIPISGFIGYAAGEDGHIYSSRAAISRGFNSAVIRLSAHPSTTSRYLAVTLRNGGRAHMRLVHRLICAAYHGDPKEGEVASHINGDCLDNRPANLTWETQAENLKRRIAHGTDDCGVLNSRALFNSAQIRSIKSRLAIGIKACTIAREFNCNPRVIGKIKRGEHYAR